MDVHITRQPIFDIHKNLFAYELLCRQLPGVQPGDLSGDQVATSLLTTTFLTGDIEKIAGAKPCFIQCTANLLVKELTATFPKNKIIVEILADAPPSAEVLAACRTLSQQGFILALGDFVFAKELLPLIELVNIIKIDCQRTTANEISRTMHRLARCNLKYLAEKVESYEELEHARKQGFNYFQGSFFACPESLRITEVASNKALLLNLLAEVNKRETSIDRLEQIIATDVAIAYKLLRYINSACFYLLKQVESIRQAIVYLGEREIRRFVILVVISELAADKPAELVRLSVIRARFCELLAKESPDQADASELFLLGLFSLIDALLDTPMARAMEKMPLAAEVKDALTRHQGPLVPFLDAVIAYEQGRTEDCLRALGKLRISAQKVYNLYLEAIKFSFLLD